MFGSFVALAGGVALFVGWVSPRQGVDLKLVRVEDCADSTRRLCLQITNAGSSYVELGKDPKILVRVAGKWVPPEESCFDGIGSLGVREAFWPTARVQGHAEGLRLLLTYRHQSPQDQLLTFLLKHDLWEVSPSLCRWVIVRLPVHAKWRHRVLELEMPSSRAHNNSVERIGTSRSAQFAFAAHWRLVPAAHAGR